MPTDIQVVPNFDPDKILEIDLPDVQNPWLSTWWTRGVVTGMPETTMGWLVGQGWTVTGMTPDTSTTPPTPYYALAKDLMTPSSVLLGLCNSYTEAANNARDANEIRYNAIVTDWKDLLVNSQTQFDQQILQHNEDYGSYLADVETLTDEIDVLIERNLNELVLGYHIHKDVADGFLADLDSTEVARINEQFAASLAVQLQKLIDQGLYTSVVAADITARNTRDRDEQLQKHYDSLAREQLANEHRLWDQNVQIAESRSQAATSQLNAGVIGLQARKDVAAEDQRLMAYQLDTRNQLLIGLFSFVERREDTSPAWSDMSSMIAGLGDAGGGWISP